MSRNQNIHSDVKRDSKWGRDDDETDNDSEHALIHFDIGMEEIVFDACMQGMNSQSNNAQASPSIQTQLPTLQNVSAFSFSSNFESGRISNNRLSCQMLKTVSQLFRVEVASRS